MRQRANIIRTLAYEPEVILMDEPFGPLDAQTRLILQNQLLELWQEERKTIIFITHDLGEAVALADRVVVMSARPGRIKTIAPVPIPRPRDLFEIHTDERFSRHLPGAVDQPGGRGQEGSRARGKHRPECRRSRALPPGAANVEDDIRAWEAEERRDKWQLMLVRIVLAVVLLSVCGSTAPTAGSTRSGSPARCGSRVIFVIWVQDDLFEHLVITLRETFIGYSCGHAARDRDRRAAGAL